MKAASDDKASRKNNMVIHNVPECDSESYHDRQKADEHLVKTLFDQHIAEQITGPVIIRRVGGRMNSKPRTLKVQLPSEGDKLRILIGAKRLRNAPAPYTFFSLCERPAPQHSGGGKTLEQSKPKQHHLLGEMTHRQEETGTGRET